ncbi:MAG: hypothetical protein K1X29_00370 [Bdellovibrionales bacterium]|nr:hypothetical protein [Bdellovibrionales bacterium]
MIKYFCSKMRLCFVIIFMTMSLIACQKDSGDSKSNSTLTSPQQYIQDRRQLRPLDRNLPPQSHRRVRPRTPPYYEQRKVPIPIHRGEDLDEVDDSESDPKSSDPQKGYAVETTPIYRPYADAASTAPGIGYAAGPNTTYQEGLPIITGAETEGRFFTDAQNDSVMSVLVEKVNSLQGNSGQNGAQQNASKNFFVASKKLAGAISAVNLQVSANNLSAEVRFQSQASELSINFTGSFSAGKNRNSRIITLTQTNSSSYTFKAKALCVDSDSVPSHSNNGSGGTTITIARPIFPNDGHSCYNVVLQLDQMKDAKKCATVYLVHRVAYDGNGDAHIVMNTATYHLFNEDPPSLDDSRKNDSLLRLEHERKNTFPSQSARAFIKMITNTVYANDLLLSGRATQRPKKAPFLSKLSLRSWAVAYGPSYFEVLAIESAPEGATTPNYTLFYGALTKERLSTDVSPSQEVAPQQIQVAGEYPQNSSKPEQEKQKLNYASQIHSAELIFNSGRGDMSFTCHFKPDPSPNGTALSDSSTSGGGAKFTFTVQRKTNPTLPASTLRQMLDDPKEASK